MHPALSVIFFTVASGAGFGLVMLTISLHLLGGVPGMESSGTLAAILVGVVLATLGLLASTLHLANPKNAWRAFFRFRTSWLSREAVFSVLFYPCVMLYALGLWLFGGELAWWSAIAGTLAMLLALATVFTTGMIYASLRTIPQWNSPLVPANYLLLGLASGAVLLTALTVAFGGSAETVATMALVLLVIAGIAKGVYYFWIGKPQGPTINTALGITRSRIRMLEPGQSSDSFLNREFSFQAAAERILQLRLIVYVCGFILPFLMLVVLLRTDAAILALLAPLVVIGGLLAERWLFFAEARHVVNLYYGRQQC
ncbi:dimethyl sulfoxide reductase anchor subunit family protein [Billgrantia bachuensis]|uniref:Dimethyl sulfoxide reductase anchor subunit n=1 Tax=Billgrantia bachuensis TaxID=2717286 RepID=A0ABX0PTP6_9GAMM|nr:DmsC/YnfH family molybdoenzyme membrane anchor subunit [Halomonas bachuensis]NIC06284.1 dimethyl sulfoxide reductase anchor subunit [Halomonas bachuensis]